MTVPQRCGQPSSYTQALALATEAHKGQRRKFGGGPYLLHLVRTAALCATLDPDLPIEVVAAALLHDVAEDTSVTFSDLDDAGFPPWTVQIVQDMTKHETETKHDYFRRVLLTPLCSWSPIVKLCDRIDNLTDGWANAPYNWRAAYAAQSEQLLALAKLSDAILPGGYELHEHPAWWMLKEVLEQRRADPMG